MEVPGQFSENSSKNPLCVLLVYTSFILGIVGGGGGGGRRFLNHIKNTQNDLKYPKL